MDMSHFALEYVLELKRRPVKVVEKLIHELDGIGIRNIQIKQNFDENFWGK